MTREEITERKIDAMIEAYMEEVDGRENAAAFHSIEHISESFRFFGGYREFILSLEEEGKSHLLLDRMNGYMEQYIARPESDFAKRICLYIYAGALFNIFMQWLHCSKMEETLAETVGSVRRLAIA